MICFTCMPGAWGVCSDIVRYHVTQTQPASSWRCHIASSHGPAASLYVGGNSNATNKTHSIAGRDHFCHGGAGAPEAGGDAEDAAEGRRGGGTRHTSTVHGLDLLLAHTCGAVGGTMLVQEADTGELTAASRRSTCACSGHTHANLTHHSLHHHFAMHLNAAEGSGGAHHGAAGINQGS